MISRGLRACSTSQSSPRRCSTPGRKFSTTMSARSTRARNSARSAGAFRSNATERLLRFQIMNGALSPLTKGGMPRALSPAPGCSILTTSAPWSASIIAQYGPDRCEVRSSTRSPSSAPAMSSSPRVVGGASLMAWWLIKKPSDGRSGTERALMDEIQVAVDAAGIAVVTLNRPEKRNVVSLAMWRGLGEIYCDFARRSDVRVVILTGAGGHFCGGADISEFSKVRNSVEDARSYGETGRAGTQAIIDL